LVFLYLFHFVLFRYVLFRFRSVLKQLYSLIVYLYTRFCSLLQLPIFSNVLREAMRKGTEDNSQPWERYYYYYFRKSSEENNGDWESRS
jgi:hypothetical protein